MALYSSTHELLDPQPKKTKQGAGKHTKYAQTSRNHKKKAYRGQGI